MALSLGVVCKLKLLKGRDIGISFFSILPKANHSFISPISFRGIQNTNPVKADEYLLLFEAFIILTRVFLNLVSLNDYPKYQSRAG